MRLKYFFCVFLLLIIMIQAQENKEPTVTVFYWNTSTRLHDIKGISNSMVYLTSETYKLSNKPLIISNLMNFSLIGNISGTGSCPIIYCTQTGKSFLSIVNSSSITIENIRLMNCGALTEKALAKNIIPKNTTAAALFLYNVSLISVKNVTFLKSYSHAIVGVNVINITLFSVNVSQSSSTKLFNGGILLLYNTMHGIREQNVALIKQCNISGIDNQRNKVTDSSVDGISSEHVSSAAVGVIFSATITINITDTSITDTKSQQGPLVYFLCSSNNKCYFSITNSTIRNNTNVKNSSIYMINLHKGSAPVIGSSFFLSINSCNFQFNKANLATIVQIKQYCHESVSKNAFILSLSSTKFQQNEADEAIWNVKSSHLLLSQNIKCIFYDNNFNLNSVKNGSGVIIANFTKATMKGKNLFERNFIKNSIFVLHKTPSIFEGNTTFINNKADCIMIMYKYTTLKDGAVIIIFNNSYFHSKFNSVIISFEESAYKLGPCPFQFNYTEVAYKRNLENITTAVQITHNTAYGKIIKGGMLNSCYWLKNSTYQEYTPGSVYQKAVHFDQVEASISNQHSTSVCMCNRNDKHNTDCVVDQLGQVMTGDNIKFSLKALKPQHKVVVYIDYSELLPNSFVQPCQLTTSSPKIHLVENNCTPIYYTIASPDAATQNICSLYIKIKVNETHETIYIYYLDILPCLPGFILQNGVCECNSRLLKAIPELKCQVKVYAFIRPKNYWIEYNQALGEIRYSRTCQNDYCLPVESPLQLQDPTKQCLHNKAGTACGQCPAGYNAVFGSSQCKKCSNKGLFLIPVFICAGILLILALFILNLTVVDGKINGFIFYVNAVIINSSRIFPQRGIAYTIVSLCNLDLGIETCFYSDMTEYSKVWLRLIFPIYLLLIIGMLVYASRYSKRIEMLTRKRVIPVIATTLLLSYNKILLVTSSVLFSFVIVHSLDSDKTEWFWSIDTSIPLFGAKFCLLFVVCLLIFAFILIPINFFLIFTNLSYKSRFIVNNLKPFFDVYQAPFKEKSRYLLGIELILRAVSMAANFLSISKVVAINITIMILYLSYFCLYQPFKRRVNKYIYVSFICNLACVPTLIVYNHYVFNKTYYFALNFLMFLAFLEFAIIVIYYFCTNILSWNISFTCIQTLFKIISGKVKKPKSPTSYDANFVKHIEEIQPVANYTEFREELLELDL